MQYFAISAVLLIISLVLSYSTGDNSNVIIVGAGAAGIATASKLLENNFTNFLILEANDRIGGRIFSVKFGDGFVDLGAEWCHGEEDNIVYSLANGLNLLEHTFPNVSYLNLIHSKLNTNANVAREIFQLYDSIYEVDNQGEDGLSIGESFMIKYNNSIEKLYASDTTAKQVATDSTELLFHMIAAAEGSFSWLEPSARRSYKHCEGDYMLSWNGRGYKTILDVLLKRYPDPKNALPIDGKIKLNKEVTKITLVNNSSKKSTKVYLQCADGEKFTADSVVVTISLGVLKQKEETLFSPKLPSNKRKAIEDIGFGAVMKIFLLFSERWWPADDFAAFGLVWSEEDKKTLQNEGREWILDIFLFTLTDNNVNVLATWVSGQHVPDIEKESDETLLSAIMFIFEKFFTGRYNVTRPIKMIRSRWFSDPHFYGTYSYETIASREHAVFALEELAQPLISSEGKPVLLFAGEATHPYYYSTVHGAIESGFREAKRVLDIYS